MTSEKTPILRSKLRAPSPTEGTIDRPSLAHQLLTTTASVWIVTAPAGYGKTTLLAQALADDDRATAWVSVDRADNDAVRFWTHVSAALGERLDDTLDHVNQALVDGAESRILCRIDEQCCRVGLVVANYSSTPVACPTSMRYPSGSRM